MKAKAPKIWVTDQKQTHRIGNGIDSLETGLCIHGNLG